MMVLWTGPTARSSRFDYSFEEPCVKLGYCLPPEENLRLELAPPRKVDSFTGAVFEAEGMGDMSYPEVRRQVRAVVEQHMSRWAGAGSRMFGDSPGEGLWSPRWGASSGGCAQTTQAPSGAPGPPGSAPR